MIAKRAAARLTHGAAAKTFLTTDDFVALTTAKDRRSSEHTKSTQCASVRKREQAATHIFVTFGEVPISGGAGEGEVAEIEEELHHPQEVEEQVSSQSAPVECARGGDVGGRVGVLNSGGVAERCRRIDRDQHVQWRVGDRAWHRDGEDIDHGDQPQREIQQRGDQGQEGEEDDGFHIAYCMGCFFDNLRDEHRMNPHRTKLFKSAIITSQNKFKSRVNKTHLNGDADAVVHGAQDEKSDADQASQHGAEDERSAGHVIISILIVGVEAIQDEIGADEGAAAHDEDDAQSHDAPCTLAQECHKAEGHEEGRS